MDSWDSLKESLKNMGQKAKGIKTTVGDEKKKLNYFMDKYKVIRRMYIAGILINIYIIYEKTAWYYQLEELNQTALNTKNAYR